MGLSTSKSVRSRLKHEEMLPSGESAKLGASVFCRSGIT